MPDPTPNPYRQILGRHFPEPFIALLAFLMGVWLWDHYFGAKPPGEPGYEPGTDQLTLVKLDRDYRLAGAMAGDPAWLRKMVGASKPEKIKRAGLESLEILGKEHSLQPSSEQVRVVLLAEQHAAPILEALRQDGAVIQETDFPESYEEVVHRLTEGRGTWSDLSIARAYAVERPPGPEMALAQKTFDEGSALLRKRAIVSRGVVWLLVLASSFFIPDTLRRLAAAVRKPATGYASRWSAPLGLVVFLAATLSWIGFSLAMRAGFTAVKDIPAGLALALDAAMRLLPTLIAVGLLFRRGRHVVRVFGLNRLPSWPLVLGAFALLVWCNELVLPFLKGWSSHDPTGGLSNDEDGARGLIFALVSACLMAPLTEEVLYRGVLFRSMANRFGVLAGAVLSSGAFALVHFYDLYGLATVGLFGFVCALVFSSTRTLSAAMALHLLYNVAIKLPEWMVYHSGLH